MVNEKEFQLSDNLLWGLKFKVDVDECDTKLHIEEKAKQKVLQFIEHHNLQIIRERFLENHYHIHTTLEEILVSDEIQFLCSH